MSLDAVIGSHAGPSKTQEALLFGTAIDVFEVGQVVPPTEALVVGSRYMGHVPRPFVPKDGLRVSFQQVTAGTIEFAISCGNDGLLIFKHGFYTWNYTSGIDSFLIPATEFAPWVTAEPGLPPGARMTLGIQQILGVGYGFAFKGLRMEFLGEWRQ
jgi:hypothetical protein